MMGFMWLPNGVRLLLFWNRTAAFVSKAYPQMRWTVANGVMDNGCKRPYVGTVAEDEIELRYGEIKTWRLLLSLSSDQKHRSIRWQ